MDENRFSEENNNENDIEEAGITMQIDSMDDGKNNKSLGREIFEWIQAITVALVVAMFLNNFVFVMVKVDGDSMNPTLQDEQRLIVTRFDKDYEQGDIIVFAPVSRPEDRYIKRVIATEGQTVSFDYAKGAVLIDGELIYEPYISEPIDMGHFGSFYPGGKSSAVVPEDCLFVMGDNRNNSTDSRMEGVGMVHKDTVTGKAVLRWWPINKFGVDFDGQ